MAYEDYLAKMSKYISTPHYLMTHLYAYFLTLCGWTLGTESGEIMSLCKLLQILYVSLASSAIFCIFLSRIHSLCILIFYTLFLSFFSYFFILKISTDIKLWIGWVTNSHAMRFLVIWLNKQYVIPIFKYRVYLKWEPFGLTV